MTQFVPQDRKEAEKVAEEMKRIFVLDGGLRITPVKIPKSEWGEEDFLRKNRQPADSCSEAGLGFHYLCWLCNETRSPTLQRVSSKSEEKKTIGLFNLQRESEGR